MTVPCPSCGFDGWLTVPEAAKRLGVSDTTVRTYLVNGRLPKTAHEIIPGGSRYLIHEDDVQAIKEGVA